MRQYFKYNGKQYRAIFHPKGNTLPRKKRQAVTLVKYLSDGEWIKVAEFYCDKMPDIDTIIKEMYGGKQ